jgi:hypothetical protein
MSLYLAPSLGWRLLPAPGGDNLAELLGEARALLEQIEDEVGRLGAEVLAIRAGNLAAFGPFGRIFDPLGLDQRASVYIGLIEQLEAFVTDVFNRVEKKALAGDVSAARRLRDSTARILGVAVTSTPVRELSDDARATVDNAIDDLRSLLNSAAKLALGGLALILAIKVVSALKR